MIYQARDMAVLGLSLFYGFPEYYNLFGRKQTVAAGKTVYSTNRRFLGAYKGADGIKTGYTNAAGFNLVSSAQRGEKRIIAVVFGGRSTATRNAPNPTSDRCASCLTTAGRAVMGMVMVLGRGW